jgi:putative hydrolase of the HAD superfamily
VLEVQRDRTPSPPQDPASGVHRRRVADRTVDPDHVGTQIRQDHAGERRRTDRGQLYHPDPGEWTSHPAHPFLDCLPCHTARMPLLLADLDNTLLDRDAAFRTGMIRFLSDHGLPASDVDWVIGIDDHGLVPRESVAVAIRDRYGLDLPLAEVVRALLDGVVDNVTLAEPTRRALEVARSAGWTPVIVTNGAVTRQESKIRRVGLDRCVAAWVVSEGIGVAKPDPAIFHAAARAVDSPLTGAWMLGDNPLADIGGAHRLGLRSGWLHLGRAWREPEFHPTFVADTVADAIDRVVAAGTMAG